MLATRKFGKLDFDVSVVGFGGASVSGEGGGYGFGAISETEAITLLHAAKNLGINLFDTAPVYGFGLSERRIGKAFKTTRDSVFIVSKCGVYSEDGEKAQITNSPDIVEKMLHQSLKDLDTDYIDLYMIHWPDSKVDIRKPMEVLAKYQAQGKIKAIGLCNTNPDDYQKAKDVARVDVLQSNCNLFDRSAQKDLWSFVREDELGFMCYGTYDKGILTGRATADRKYDAHDLRSKSAQWLRENKEPKFAAVQKIQELVKNQNFDLVSVALNGVLSHPEVSTALCGIRNIAQLESTIAATQVEVPQEVLDEVYKLTDIA